MKNNVTDNQLTLDLEFKDDIPSVVAKKSSEVINFNNFKKESEVRRISQKSTVWSKIASRAEHLYS